MKQLIVIGSLLLGGCCARQMDEVAPAPRLILRFDYHYNGFSSTDTLFHISGYNQHGGNSFLYIKQPEFESDSQRIIYFYSADFGKLVIESPSSGFKDSLMDVGYESRKIKRGNARCTYFIYHDFNIHATHKGQNLSSGESSTLEIHITK